MENEVPTLYIQWRVINLGAYISGDAMMHLTCDVNHKIFLLNRDRHRIFCWREKAKNIISREIITHISSVPSKYFQ